MYFNYRLVHDVLGIAPEVALDVARHRVEQPLPGLSPLPPDVGRQYQVLLCEVVKPARLRGGLVHLDVQARPSDQPRVQSLAELLLAHDATPGSVDEVGAPLHSLERLGPQARARLVVQRAVDGDKVGALEKVVQGYDLGPGARPVAPARDQNLHPEHPRHLTDLGTDRPPPADQAHCLPGQLEVPQPLEGRPSLPVLGTPAPQLALLLNQAAAQAQHERHHHRGHGIRGVLRDVAHGDPPLLRRLAVDVVVPRPRLTDQFDAAREKGHNPGGKLHLLRHHHLSTFRDSAEGVARLRALVEVPLANHPLEGLEREALVEIQLVRVQGRS
mmetsp:Transcript_10614/g.29964  ORF Transcript_10614/g.29964 Transcript_10614/m.29964 type:complete len:329 (-) Transcript_10614:157-1143(-)